jgi:hypothetical protein
MRCALEGLLVTLAAFAWIPALALIGWLFEVSAKRWRQFKQLRQKAALYDERIAELSQLDKYRERLSKEKEAIDKIVEEKTIGFPWLSYAFADYYYLQNLQEANYLRYKPHPAVKAAERVSEIALTRRQVEGQFKITRYLLLYYEKLFPWLIDFRGEDLDDLIERTIHKKDDSSEGVEALEEDDDKSIDPARAWLTSFEYDNLTTAEKYQLALDRYWRKPKSNWEIGRDYERFVGHLYETLGFTVTYQARKGRHVEIVQCKNWSQEKVIHEKHIFQLFGTVVAFRVDNPKDTVTAKFVTSTRLSERSKLFASLLGIDIQESLVLQPYPCIKCNVSRKTGEKVYHLPFDQQYDRTYIEGQRLECYVASVAEAEVLGFRRARRWHALGNNRTIASAV